MQNETKIGIILAVIGVALVLYFALGYSSVIRFSATGASTAVQNTSPVLNSSTSGTILLTPAEVAKHNSETSCWMIVSGKVYDVTSYLYQHPGGAQNILNYCGADGTVAFLTKGGRGSHSQNAFAILDSFYIGGLNGAAINAVTKVATQQVQYPDD
jgi:cytochrome b involved in lipid metabolism